MNEDKKLAQVFHYDLYGKRDEKYNFLLSNNLETVQWRELEFEDHNFFFVPKDYGVKVEYDNGFAITDLFITNGPGIISKRDGLAFQETKNGIVEKVKDIYNLSCEEIKRKYDKISWDSRDGKVEFCKKNVMKYGLDDKYFVQCNYRPFDIKWTYYTGESRGFLGWPVQKIMQHFLRGKNVGLVTARQCVGNWQYVMCTKNICDFNLTGKAGRFGSGSVFPLYIYLEANKLFGNEKRKPNLDEIIVNEIAKTVDLKFESEKSGDTDKFAPIDLLDYIYAVLHSPAYREKYKEFLKIDFPRVPFPESAEQFRRLAALGSELRQLHLMEHPALHALQNSIAAYNERGSNTVEKPRWEPAAAATLAPISTSPAETLAPADAAVAANAPSPSGAPLLGRVWINDTQYFDGVPSVAWNFYIGGYQPAQKWLKDRIGRTLEYDDIVHYQRIIKVLAMTNEIMTNIDNND